MNEGIEEIVRVLFHLNGYTKVSVESTEGIGMADGGIVWEITTEEIPRHLRHIGSRFVVLRKSLIDVSGDNMDQYRRAINNIEICEVKP